MRQSDAHAWAEVWLAGQGWVRVDPTAAVSPARIGSFTRLQSPRGAVANAIFGNVNPRLALNLRAAWDAVNNRWNQWVLNYTQSTQLKLLENLGIEAPTWEDLIYLLCGIVVAVSLAGAAIGLWERQRQDPWLRLLRLANKSLQAAGISTPHNPTPRQLADAMGRAERPVDWQTWRDWLLRLEALRYGASDQPGGFRAQLATLQRELQHLRLKT